jgi:hypothetical protein
VKRSTQAGLAVLTAAAVGAALFWTRPWLPAPVTASRTAGVDAVRYLTPDDAAPVLPTDSGIGRVVFAYRAEDGRTFLVTTGGRQYRADLGEFDTLSPRGRWLLSGHGRMRDLTGTATRDLDGFASFTWSPNEQWVLGGSAVRRTLVEVATGRATGIGDSVFAASVLDDGTLLDDGGHTEGAEIGDPDKVQLRVREPATGRQLRTVDVDASADLRGEEEALEGRLGVYQDQVGPGDRIMFTIAGRIGVGSLVVSLRDGAIVRRMPPATVAFAGDNFYARPSDTELDVVTAEGAVTAAYRFPAKVQILLPGLPVWR